MTCPDRLTAGTVVYLRTIARTTTPPPRLDDGVPLSRGEAWSVAAIVGAAAALLVLAGLLVFGGVG